MKENISFKDVRYYHRSCDNQKNLVLETSNFINLSRDKEK